MQGEHLLPPCILHHMEEKETEAFILLNTGLAVHQADWNYKQVNSPFARIYLVTEGRARLHLQDSVHDLTPGHLYLIPPFMLHSYECNEYFVLYYIHVYENCFSGRRMMEDYRFPVEVDAAPLDGMLVRRLLDINPGWELKHYDPSSYDNPSALMQRIALDVRRPVCVTYETRGILFQLLSRFFRGASLKYQVTDRIRKVLQYIHEHIDRPVYVDELSDICCLSKDHFIRLFKKEMQVTPIQYINKKKIEKAQLMIISGRQSMKDIAYNLSFENVSYFNRLFRRYTEMTPLEYRERL
ncbi:MAG: AraC family transcriptional regulator [Tannerella sp.]|jgi:AraC-like DNA-binding protein/mannose-6-phosphate isomerase-like protein (cupin superfamily)|nr:AraC family transcriptional regulator [Tannerella sp.]